MPQRPDIEVVYLMVVLMLVILTGYFIYHKPAEHNRDRGCDSGEICPVGPRTK